MDKYKINNESKETHFNEILVDMKKIIEQKLADNDKQSGKMSSLRRKFMKINLQKLLDFAIFIWYADVAQLARATDS